MRLTLVISSLCMGGAEGVFARLANGLRARGHEIAVLTLDDGSVPPFYTLDPRIRHRALGLAGATAGLLDALWSNLRRVRALRRAVLTSHGGQRPDAVLSFMDATNVLVLLAVGRLLPVAVSERVHPAHYDIGRLWSALRLYAYRRAAAVAVQADSVAGWFPPRIRERCEIIPNPVASPEAAPLPEALRQRDGKILVGMGRLAQQKGFDLLLDAFARLAPAHPDWTLAILGEGPERERLERQRAALGLAGHVLLPGRVDNPSGVLRKADLFVLPSRFEGFPNSLCEALACGLPAVAFDCPSGPAEILRHEVDGLLVPPGDVEALAAALGRLMADADLRARMAARAPEVLERFGSEQVLDLWEALLQRIAKPGAAGRGWRHHEADLGG